MVLVVGDYVTLYVPTEESQNAQLIKKKKKRIINQTENQLLNKKEFHAELVIMKQKNTLQ